MLLGFFVGKDHYRPRAHRPAQGVRLCRNVNRQVASRRTRIVHIRRQAVDEARTRGLRSGTLAMGATRATAGDRGGMAKRSQHSFMKRQKEIKRQQKAQDKVARRQGKKKQATDLELLDTAEQPEEMPDTTERPEEQTES